MGEAEHLEFGNRLSGGETLANTQRHTTWLILEIENRACICQSSQRLNIAPEMDVITRS
jgi:hypothetical protein